MYMWIYYLLILLSLVIKPLWSYTVFFLSYWYNYLLSCYLMGGKKWKFPHTQMPINGLIEYTVCKASLASIKAFCFVCFIVIDLNFLHREVKEYARFEEKSRMSEITDFFFIFLKHFFKTFKLLAHFLCLFFILFCSEFLCLEVTFCAIV